MIRASLSLSGVSWATMLADLKEQETGKGSEEQKPLFEEKDFHWG